MVFTCALYICVVHFVTLSSSWCSLSSLSLLIKSESEAFIVQFHCECPPPLVEYPNIYLENCLANCNCYKFSSGEILTVSLFFIRAMFIPALFKSFDCCFNLSSISTLDIFFTCFLLKSGFLSALRTKRIPKDSFRCLQLEQSSDPKAARFWRLQVNKIKIKKNFNMLIIRQ